METTDRHSMAVALQDVADQARANPRQAAAHVLEAVMARLGRGIDEAREKGASDTQLACLIDFAAVLKDMAAKLAAACGGEPAPVEPPVDEGEQGEEAPPVEEAPPEAYAPPVEEAPPAEPPVEEPPEEPATHSKKGKRN